MPIPEEEINKHLEFLLTNSDPGDALGAMHIVTCPRTPLGQPDVDKREASVFVMAFGPTDDGMTPEDYVILTVANADQRFRDANQIPLFAGLKQEMFSVEPFDEQAADLIRAGKSIGEHPRAGELTVVYAAARDGRRWLGRRWLTGPQAGTTEGPALLKGPQDPHEGLGHMSRAVRKLVGIYER